MKALISIFTLFQLLNSSFAAQGNTILIATAKSAQSINIDMNGVSPKIQDIAYKLSHGAIKINLTYTYNEEISEGNRWEEELSFYTIEKKCLLIDDYKILKGNVKKIASDYSCTELARTKL